MNRVTCWLTDCCQSGAAERGVNQRRSDARRRGGKMGGGGRRCRHRWRGRGRRGLNFNLRGIDRRGSQLLRGRGECRHVTAFCRGVALFTFTRGKGRYVNVRAAFRRGGGPGEETLPAAAAVGVTVVVAVC